MTSFNYLSQKRVEGGRNVILFLMWASIRVTTCPPLVNDTQFASRTIHNSNTTDTIIRQHTHGHILVTDKTS